ncbi:class I SAM-dependent methyltransferase [Dictyobacter formicarum]|uniref:Methyltransferase domain-containing protein n=1 Tax=Dictyobacter formicarum TaxID=2778368 RepID=A0ABQ3VB97_9CHLR|nr:class I SAM-dependent methyltransferase [Dictyobacter formicarum]GHO82736.1 hypothetical protein KSZ_07420 [Dictyobacter formicarum]
MIEHKEPFNPQAYWEDRLRVHPDITGVGYLGLSPRFVEIQYYSRKLQVERALQRIGLTDLSNCSVLDVGSGTGIWLDFWHQHGAQHVTGLDFAQPSIHRLKREFPDDLIIQADLSVIPLPLNVTTRFDIISAFDVLLHIVDPDHLRRAIANLATHCTPGGWLIIFDPITCDRGYVPSVSYAIHNKVRSLAEYSKILTEHGFAIETIQPATVFLNNPLEATSHLAFLAYKACWKITRAWGRSNRLSQLIGPYAVKWDQIACHLCSGDSAPTAKILLARKLH